MVNTPNIFGTKKIPQSIYHHNILTHLFTIVAQVYLNRSQQKHP